MPKVIISESAVSANPFISADGLLNFDAVAKLQEKVAGVIKASVPTKKTPDAEPAKVVAVYVKKRTAKPVKYSVAMQKKGDHKYLVARATKIAMRKRLAPEALARVAVVLQVIETEDKTLAANLKKAVAAINSHVKKLERVVAKVTTEKGKLRDAANAVFDKSVGLLKEKLLSAGVKEADIVEATGMMGKTVLVRLSKENIVSIGKADATRFAAAVKAAKAAAPAADVAPAKAPRAAKVVTKMPVAKKTTRKPAAK